MRVFEDDLLTVTDSGECTVPGYLVLRLKPAGATLGGLDARDAGRVGAMLSRCARAIVSVVGAERVYCLSFCEVEPQLHFHLFPRTRWLLDTYQAAAGAAGRPVSGPALFEWARGRFPAGTATPGPPPDLAEACARLQERLSRPGEDR